MIYRPLFVGAPIPFRCIEPKCRRESEEGRACKVCAMLDSMLRALREIEADHGQRK